ncbi:MAG: Ig-like domain-containing protein, partial [Bacteroidales bacterium]|nr:Ig-like domain-containing protein [Bacteroidales bacterium]
GDTLALTITEPAVPVTSITVTAAGGVTEIVVGNTLQYSATVLPVDASNLSVAWSVVIGTGSASISLEGLLTGGLPGRVDVIAMAMDGTGMGDTLALTIAAPEVPVTGITVTAAGGVTAVDEGNTLQFSAAVMPVDASYPVVAWSVVNSTGSASITSGGLVTALTTGTVDVVATAADGSGVSDSFSLTIVASTVPVSNISIVSAGGVSVVDEGNTLQFTASVLPSNATNQAVLWSVNHGTGTADISQNGLLTAGTEGTVDVLASAQDGSGIGSFFALSIQGPDGLSEESKSSTIVLYPNPSPGKFYLDAGDLSIVKIEVVSAAGSVVLELFPEPGERVIELDLSDQKPGAFFIHTLSKEQSSVHRVIISR